MKDTKDLLNFLDSDLEYLDVDLKVEENPLEKMVIKFITDNELTDGEYEVHGSFLFRAFQYTYVDYSVTRQEFYEVIRSKLKNSPGRNVYFVNQAPLFFSSKYLTKGIQRVVNKPMRKYHRKQIEEFTKQYELDKNPEGWIHSHILYAIFKHTHPKSWITVVPFTKGIALYLKTKRVKHHWYFYINCGKLDSFIKIIDTDKINLGINKGLLNEETRNKEELQKKFTKGKNQISGIRPLFKLKN